MQINILKTHSTSATLDADLVENKIKTRFIDRKNNFKKHHNNDTRFQHIQLLDIGTSKDMSEAKGLLFKSTFYMIPYKCLTLTERCQEIIKDNKIEILTVMFALQVNMEQI